MPLISLLAGRLERVYEDPDYQFPEWPHDIVSTRTCPNDGDRVETDASKPLQLMEGTSQMTKE